MNTIARLRRFAAPYSKQSLLALLLLTAIVLMDLAIPRLIQRIIDQGIGGSNTTLVLNTTLVMLGLTVISTLFAIGNNLLSVQVGEGFGRDVRDALFTKLQSFSFKNLDHLQTGQLMVRLTSDVIMVERILRVFLRIGTRAPLLMVGSLILMFSTSPRLALAILPLLLVTMLVIAWFITKTQPLYLTVQRKLDAVNTVLQENIAGIRVVKAFTRAPYETGRFSDANQDFAGQSMRVMQWMAFLMPALAFFINLGVVLVILIGGYQTIQGELSLGQVVAFTNYLLTTMTPLVIMSNLAQVLAAANASAERICEVLDVVPDIDEPPASDPLPGAASPFIEFENVGFSYNGDGSEPVLEGINLVANLGETVAILGATGSGKTTLINLIPRFYDVSSGRILVGGRDVRFIPQDELLANIGIAMQESVLFSGSIRDNIRYGRPTAGEDEVLAAAHAAQAHEFIIQLPHGYDTHVEQRGVNLSGGQKQRLAIARALLVQPKILILDDSTSAVDVETEANIQHALEQGKAERISFIVAQRISTVLNADKIVVLDKGRIAALGRHAQLLHTSPIYAEIYASQLGDRPPGANEAGRSPHG